MKLLITGGFGFLGGRLAQFLAAEGNHEILLGSRQRDEPPAWLPQARTVRLRWDSPGSLDDALGGADAVVHLAGMNAEECASTPLAALECNAVATGRLLHAAVRQGVKRFVYLSTAHVYGSPLAGRITEDTCPLSLHPYATSHRAGEDLVRAAHRKREIEGVVVRLSNAFGAPVHKDVNCWMLLVNDLCRQSVTARRLVLRSSGLQRRDFITLTDACGAIGHLVALSREALADGLFNVGGGWSPSVLEMTERIAERVYCMTGNRPAIRRKEDGYDESHGMLDYSSEKIAGTGFESRGDRNVDQEIDRLVLFCMEHFAENSCGR